MFKGILGKYNDLKIGHKLVLIFLLISIVPITVLQGFHFAVVRQAMIKQSDELIYNNLIQISERTNLSLENYTNLLYQIYVDEEIIDQISIIGNGTPSRRASAKSRIRNILHKSAGVIDGIRCISLVCSNGETVAYDFTTDSAVWNLWSKFSDMRISPPYLDSKGIARMVITPTMKFSDNGEMKYYFHISKRMYDFDHLDKGSIATVIMTIDADVLNDLCNSSDEPDSSINFIISPSGKVISYPDDTFIASDTTDGLDSFVRKSGFLADSNTIGINTYTDSSTGWIFVNAYDREKVLKDVIHTQHLILTISYILLLLVFLIIIYTTKHFGHSVQNILDGMKTVQDGNLEEIIPVRSRDEFGSIAENFNLMTKRVKELLSEITSAKDRQRKAELKALEAQINPHFLYNTLDSINWMAIENGENDISKALSNLGLILRHTVSKVDALVTVAVERDFLIRYLELQSLRYEEAFSYEINVAPETEKLYVHKLLIQPLVENAILHGFEDIENGGSLTINIDTSEDTSYLQISVADNGKGIPPEVLAALKNRDDVVQKSGLGLYNVFSRLAIYYGDDAHWNINSVAEIGTEITLYIPYKLCL